MEPSSHYHTARPDGPHGSREGNDGADPALSLIAMSPAPQATDECWRKLLDASSQPTLVVDDRSTILYWNAAAIGLLGNEQDASPRERGERSLWELLESNDRHRLLHSIGQVLGGDCTQSRLTLEGHDGLELCLCPVTWGNGTAAHVSVEVESAAAARRAEKALADVVRALPVGFALFDARERLTVFNDGYLSIHPQVVRRHVRRGITFSEIIDLHLAHQTLASAIGKEEEWRQNRLEEFRAGGTVRSVQRSKGEWHQINDRRLADGSTVVICTDISALKAQQSALDDARQRLADYAGSASDWFWETDEQHRLTFLSERFTQLTGIPSERFIGRFRGNVPGITVSQAAREAHREDLNQRRPFRDFRYSVSAPDGRILHVSVNGMPVFRAGDVFAGYRGTGMNITDSVVAKAAQDRFMEAIESINDGYSLWDSEDRLVVFNSTWADFVREDTRLPLEPGLSHEELVRDSLANGAYPSAATDREGWLAERLRRHRAGERPFEMERRKGRWYLVRERRTPDGGILQTTSDISTLKRREQALKDSEERFRSFAESAADWFWELDTELRFTFISSRFEQITGFNAASLMGQPFEKLAQNEASAQPLRMALRTLRAGNRIQDVEFYSAASGSNLVVHALTGQAIQGPGDCVTGYRGTGRDVTQARLMSMQLAYQASHDELTGLVNRRGFEQRLSRALEAVASGRGEHALCYLDLDQFKVVNDTCGHAAGDLLLKQLGSLLQEHVRGHDTVARLGGDEFAVLLEHCDLPQARQVAESLRVAIEAFQFNWQDKHFRLGASLGVVMIRAGTAMSDLMRAVDSACYVAKEQGRNRVHVFEPDDEELNRREGELNWVARLNKALAEDRFTLFAQPIRPCGNARTHDHEHFEILLRLRGEDGEVIGPGSFLPAAERYGLATRIDRWVVHNSFELLRSRPARLRPGSFLSINLSGRSLGDRDFCDYVLRHLRDPLIAGEQVCFEVTETAAIADLAAAERFIQATREHGCRFALDDFGTGLSSFAYLRDLAVDFVKIDGAFIKDIERDPVSLAMVRSIHQVASVLGKRTIAEYVSSDRAVELLAEIGIDYVQGFGVARPERIERVLP